MAANGNKCKNLPV